MAQDIGQDTGYKPGPIGLNPGQSGKIDWLKQWEMPAFPAGGQQIPWQNQFPQGQAALGMPQMQADNYGKPAQPFNTNWGWGPTQQGGPGKPTWNIFGQQRPGQGPYATNAPADAWGKPNYNIYGALPPARQSMVAPGSGQAGPAIGDQFAQGPDVGFTDPLTGEFVPTGNEMWGFDPVTGEYMTADTIPWTKEDILNGEGDQRFRTWALAQQQPELNPTQNMQDQFPMLTDERLEQLYTDWLAEQKPEEMPETPTGGGGGGQPYPVYPYIPSSWGSGGGKGGGGYKNFFKVLYWRVGE